LSLGVYNGAWVAFEKGANGPSRRVWGRFVVNPKILDKFNNRGAQTY